MKKMQMKRQKDSIIKRKSWAAWYHEDEVWMEESQIPLLHFHCLDEQTWMGLSFSTKRGGVSTGYLSSMNLGWNQGDSRENVCENYRRICDAMQVDAKNLVLSDQVHDTKLAYVTQAQAAGEQMEKKLTGIDGLVTDVHGLVLATSYADCVPLFFVDPEHRIIASSHSGWKGTVQKIGKKTVEKLQSMGSCPQKIIAVIGPSICQDCYEVSEDVARAFREAYSVEECTDILAPGRITQSGEQKTQLDLWSANWHQLRQAGLMPENIHISGVCTCCNSDLLFSHRATAGRRGNLNGFIYIH